MTTQSPSKAPLFVDHRKGLTATDTLSGVSQKKGMNFTGHEFAHFTVIPTGGANPDVAVAVWDGERWVGLTEAEASQSGVGADTPYGFTVRAAGRRLLVYVTAIAGGELDVKASGWDAHGGAA